MTDSASSSCGDEAEAEDEIATRSGGESQPDRRLFTRGNIKQGSAQAKPETTRRVQKPEQKNVIAGKRANVRNSDKRFAKLGSQQSTSRSPLKLHQQAARLQVVPPQQPQAHYGSGLLFSQNKSKKVAPVPMSAVQSQLRNKVPSSRNAKTGDFYTKSVPSLGNEQTKPANEGSSATSTDIGDKRARLGKEQTLAMTMSPKAQPKVGANMGSKKVANPRHTSTSKFDRTY